MNLSDKVMGTDNQQERLISNDYLAGFTDGEGSFYIGFSYRKDLPMKWQIITEFHVSQNPGGKNVLEYFKEELGCGYLKPNHNKSLNDKSWVLVVKDRNDLENKVVPFFKKHPLHTNKLLDFEMFCRVLDLIKSRKHLTKEGFIHIVEMVLKNEGEDHRRYSKSFILSHLD
jgi:hypothetical protein